MDDTIARSGRLQAFAYVVADKAALYRTLMRVFIAAKARFALHLRPADILDQLLADQAAGETPSEPLDSAALDAALGQLCDWGNLESHPDTADVATVEEFYRPRRLYQLTLRGEAAEAALEVYRETIERPGELQSAALEDILDSLLELRQYQAADKLDDAKVHRTLLALRERFDGLTSQARLFVGSLQRAIDLQGIEVETLLAYKERLIEYLERFIGDLVVSTVQIAAALQTLDAVGVQQLLDAAAARDLADALAPTEEDRSAALRMWQARWDGLRAWFINRPAHPSQSEMLRARARAAIPALLNAVAGMNDRRAARSDRSADLRTLARWFAETNSEAEAHRLWRAAFGLSPARHLRINDETLEQWDQQPVPAQTSWLHTAPIVLSPRLHASGRHARPGRSSNVIDRTREKAQLAAAAREEAAQIAAAEQRLAARRELRLSEMRDLGLLNPLEFDLFLDLLGEALSQQAQGAEEVEATSSDGTLTITMSPTRDGRRAVIPTSWGDFSGEDYFLTIRRTFEEMPSRIGEGTGNFISAQLETEQIE